MESEKPNKGLSNKIKVPIIILSFLTLCALAALFFKLANTVTADPAEKEDSAQYLRAVGDKLNDAGLQEQAIEQYIKFLDKTESDKNTRAQVAHTVGELYMQLSNCREALVWLFQAETAGPTYSRTDELKQQTDNCLNQIKTDNPQNLVTR